MTNTMTESMILVITHRAVLRPKGRVRNATSSSFPSLYLPTSALCVPGHQGSSVQLSDNPENH